MRTASIFVQHFFAATFHRGVAVFACLTGDWEEWNKESRTGGVDVEGTLKTQIMDSTAMRRSITRMAHELLERNKGLEEVVLVGIETRGARLADRLAERLLEIEGTHVEVVSLNPRPFRDDVEEALPREPLHGANITGKKVVLVDDVLYTGRTARAALDALMMTGRPRNVQLAALVDRGHRELPIRADFVGKNVPTARDESIAVRMTEVDGEDGVWIADRRR